MRAAAASFCAIALALLSSPTLGFRAGPAPLTRFQPSTLAPQRSASMSGPRRTKTVRMVSNAQNAFWNLFIARTVQSRDQFPRPLETPLNPAEVIKAKDPFSPKLWEGDRVPQYMTAEEVKEMVRVEYMNFPRPEAVKSALVVAAGTITGTWWLCLIPSLLGLIKSEYTVSYGYGWAMALVGLATMADSPVAHFGLKTLARQQALMYMLFGLRLITFLAVRSNKPYFKDFTQKIEDKANASKPKNLILNRISRMPFIVSCAFLYFCMAAPLLLTKMHGASLVAGSALMVAAKLGMVCMVAGFLTEAIGDQQKFHFKNQKEGLVTKQFYKFLRHPNYTGEQLLWSGSALTGLASLAAAVTGGVALSGQMIGLAAATLTGFAGIQFVLMQATTNLEKKQKERYGALSEYQDWVKSTWGGFTLGGASDEAESLTETDMANCEATDECPTPDDK